MLSDRLGLGTAHFGTPYARHPSVPLGTIEQILEYCIEKKILFLDTSREYGQSEAHIGHFIRSFRSNPFLIATKIQVIPASLRFQSKDGLKSFIKESIEASLKSLGIDKLHLLQLSQDCSKLIHHDALWEALDELKKENLFEQF